MKGIEIRFKVSEDLHEKIKKQADKFNRKITQEMQLLVKEKYSKVK